MSEHAFGWLPDKPDPRDLRFSSAVVHLPPSVDLRPHCPPIYDQGQLGSCTAQAICGLMEFDAMQQGAKPTTPSRLFLYYHERLLEGTVVSDAGAALRDGMKAAAKVGVPPERDWPYRITKFKTKPPAKAEADAAKHRILAYHRIRHTAFDLQSCLAGGHPFVFGFSVPESFEQIGKDGIWAVPSPTERILGGHAVLAVGYVTLNGLTYLVVRNSWGDWALGGYCFMPLVFVLSNQASDFWTATAVAA